MQLWTIASLIHQFRLTFTEVETFFSSTTAQSEGNNAQSKKKTTEIASFISRNQIEKFNLRIEALNDLYSAGTQRFWLNHGVDVKKLIVT